MNLSVTKKLLAEVLAGRLPDEASARTARAELDALERETAVEPAPVEILANRVTADQAVICLGELFQVFEGTLLRIRQTAALRVIISSEASDSLLNARKLLQKAGYEMVANRTSEPLRFMPLVTPTGR